MGGKKDNSEKCEGGSCPMPNQTNNQGNQGNKGKKEEKKEEKKNSNKKVKR